MVERVSGCLRSDLELGPKAVENLDHGSDRASSAGPDATSAVIPVDALIPVDAVTTADTVTLVDAMTPVDAVTPVFHPHDCAGRHDLFT